MKYADGPHTEAEIHVNAPPSVVWPLVTDIELPPRFSPELQRVEWLDDAREPAVGARFAGYNRNRVLTDWRTIAHIVECREPEVFGYAVVDPEGRFGDPEPPSPERPMALWRFTLEPVDEGTLLRQSVRLGPARSGVSLAIDHMPDREEEFVAFRLRELRKAMMTTLEGFKRLAEQ